MLSLKKLLFRGGAPTGLPEDVRASLDAWRASEAPALDDLHFHTRYVVVDIVSSGLDPDKDQLLGIAASSIWQGTIQPDDTFYIDFSTLDGEGAAVNRQLMAFLLFAAKAPLVTYHVPYVGGFLQRAFNERLGLDFQPQWVDMAWLMPAMFEERGHTVMPLDHWLECSAWIAGRGGAMRWPIPCCSAGFSRCSWSVLSASRSTRRPAWSTSREPAVSCAARTNTC